MCDIDVGPVDVGTGSEGSTNAQAELRSVFDLCDSKGQGFIDKDAFLELMRSMFGSSEEAIFSLMDYFDPSNCGVITFEDFRRGVAAITSFQQQQGLSSPRGSSPLSSSRQEMESPTSSAGGGADATSAVSSLSSLMLRAQSPADSGLGERTEERFECEEDDANSQQHQLQLNTSATGAFSSSKRFGGSSIGRDLSAASVANASLNSALSRRSSFSFEVNNNNDLDSFADQQIVDDLTEKVQEMEMQMSAMSDNLSVNQDLYQRVKQENSGLNQRIHVLEENIRELEVRSEQRLREERKQFNNMMERKDRERAIENEQHVSKILELQKEHMTTKEEAIKLRAQNDQLRQERSRFSDQYAEASQELEACKQDFRASQEAARREREEFHKEKQLLQQIIQDLTQRLDEVQLLLQQNVDSQGGESTHRERSTSFAQNLPLHCETMEKEIERLRMENRRLKEHNEELDEEIIGLKVARGQHLLSNRDTSTHDNNWAAETDDPSMLSKEELVLQLRSQQETNENLRDYIGKVISNIMLTHPHVLERKN